MLDYCKLSFKSDLVLSYDFIGSAVRGVIGSALKKTVCISPQKLCGGCFAKDGCLYYDFYERDFPKYRLKLPMGGKVEFEYFLFEEYVQKAPYVISAIYRAFKENGITKKRIKCDFELSLNGKSIYDGKFKEFKNSPLSFMPKEYINNPALKFLTPVRIKQDGRIVKKDLSLEILLRSIWHRYAKLKNIPVTKLPFKPEYKIKSSSFSFREIRRYSQRQKTYMNIGGVLGYMEFEYIDKKSFYLLSLGELIGVGKLVSFGLGNVEI